MTKKTKNKCWQCGKNSKDFRCKKCIANGVGLSYSNKPNYNKVIDKGVKLKDVLQPYHQDGSINYEFVSRYGADMVPDANKKKSRI